MRAFARFPASKNAQPGFQAHRTEPESQQKKSQMVLIIMQNNIYAIMQDILRNVPVPSKSIEERSRWVADFNTAALEIEENVEDDETGEKTMVINQKNDDLRNATDEWIRETTRNNRIIDLCIGIPIEYIGNIALPKEQHDTYIKLDHVQSLREMIADNICLEDIAIMLKLPKEGIEKIVRKFTITKKTNEMK